ncbi:MAG: LacI family DNA-binding transcriptional regulator [Spirochaetales bacterium]|uniref:LacI family DNA-binding transcriptional regulator n=1 Tax=Candidatus Thalassospirochaeta sargassi TaxID=3119039 RepID=A0AAJ1IEM5_9SPIO|nr:LacI family DNA-binding transcriptional regulator [Spirochaetales bacterium]
MKPVSRDEVAEAAGVSSATVSRVYNNPSSVSRNKRTAVLKAAEKLGYVPNKSASALRRNGTGIITLVEMKKKHRTYYWGDLPIFKWFYTDVLHAVKHVIDNSMYQLNIASASNSRELEALKGHTDGIICYDADEISEVEMIAASGIPYVIGHHTKAFEGFSRSSTDNFEGGRLQAILLKDAGCSKPAYITAHLDMVQPHLDRLEGFLSVYPEQNVRIVGDGIGRTAGYRAARKIISSADGIAAVNDITAAGAGYALSEAGIRVQHDIPLVGYDNMPLSIALPFKLMSIDLQPAEIYKQAAVSLLLRLSGDTGVTESVILPGIVKS